MEGWRTSGARGWPRAASALGVRGSGAHRVVHRGAALPRFRVVPTLCRGRHRRTSRLGQRMESSSSAHPALEPTGTAPLRPPGPRTSDITIARAVADAARSMPVVLGLSPGTTVLAATYGPRERVTGVVVRHPGPHAIALEVHVVLRNPQAHAGVDAEARGDRPHAPASAGTAGEAVLTGAADQIREAVYRAARRLDTPPLTSVDILIDDIEAPT